ncbi:MAG: hypothetical protein ACSHX7_14105 [Luteolibacter sp.]
MKRYILAIGLLFSIILPAESALKDDLGKTYSVWRDAIIRKDFRTWQLVTAAHRQVEVRNRILSQKRAFPAALFELPAPPPSLQGLKFLDAQVNGRTATASFFGKVDFGVGGKPTDNLLVLSFVSGARGWAYDRAQYVNLSALPDVRKELAAGDISYLKGVPEAQPTGLVPPTPIAVNPATTIAKVYVFSPGRQVDVVVNKVSRHNFSNAKEAELVIGGARNGANEIQYSIRKMDGGKGNESLTIRVYLLSEVQGVQPIKAFEYQIQENEPFKPFGSGTFVIDAATLSKLNGR